MVSVPTYVTWGVLHPLSQEIIKRKTFACTPHMIMLIRRAHDVIMASTFGTHGDLAGPAMASSPGIGVFCASLALLYVDHGAWIDSTLHSQE